jgi:hypothetical protein
MNYAVKQCSPDGRMDVRFATNLVTLIDGIADVTVDV